MEKRDENDIEKWVTVNGARIPIFKDGSIGGPKALQERVKILQNLEQQINKDFDEKQKQIASRKAEADKLNNKKSKSEPKIDEKLKNAPYADDEHKPEYMKKVKKGDFFKLNNKPTGTVYVRGDYDKGLKAFECYKYEDVNSTRWIKGNKIVYIGFTY